MALRLPSFLVGFLICLWWPAAVSGIALLIGAFASRPDFLSVMPFIAFGMFVVTGLIDGYMSSSGRARTMGIVSRALADAAPMATFALLPLSFAVPGSFGDDQAGRDLRMEGLYPPVAIAVWLTVFAIVVFGWRAVRKHRPVVPAAATADA